MPTGPLTYEGPPPVSAAWREGDHPGARQWADVGALLTTHGALIPQVTVAYETWGTLAPDRSNAIYVAHALTGDSHVVGEPGPGHITGGWWEGLVGPGAPIDTNTWFVVCANVLGGCQGTTGPASMHPDGDGPWGSRFPVITVADMVEVERRLADHLGIEAWAMMLGPSLGGMRVLEWMVAHPDRVRSGLVLGSTAAVSADQIGTHEVQIAAIQADPNFHGGDYYSSTVGPHVGMGIARRIAHLTYRTEGELDARFARDWQTTQHPATGGQFAVESYLDHHADKLARRFDANTYIALTRAMSLFDVGEGRGGTEVAVSTIRQPLTVVSIDTDRLFPPRLQQLLVDHAPGADALHVLSSPFGHDGFLVEHDQVGGFIAHALSRIDTPSRV